MCLAVPGRLIEVTEQDDVRIGLVDYGSETRRVRLDYVPDLEVGEYTIVHIGFALERIDEATALETLQLFREIDELGSGAS